MNTQNHPDALAIEGIKFEHWFLRNNRWHGTVYDEYTRQEYDVRETLFGWNVNDDNGQDHHRHVFLDAIQAARYAAPRLGTDADEPSAFEEGGVKLLRAIVEDRGLQEGHEALDELIERADGDKWVLIVGNPFDGLRVKGPFSSPDEIDGYVEAHHRGEEWWVVQLSRRES